MNKKTPYFLIFTVAITLFLAPIASSLPDGLERVAHDLGFIANEAKPLFELFPDYQVPYVENEWIGTALSGIVGLFLCLGVVYLYGRAYTLLTRTKKRADLPVTFRRNRT
ncbi:PDGLE domain-containing protein [Ammoniphilus sp. CFH 90114]|uniref:PDGLE domain-containing protein n=1 Tax=Ammoniphilus sp. CFH 90114 TaxID=2493665 RepID=UPI00100E5388|nr:PDGLE domain-containing protein [Ammoniphilus sp. CFH 90114]RXT14780.1 hypothetical protein EIZ39_00775 [Ammoniphilus sp. CFH 90114]